MYFVERKKIEEILDYIDRLLQEYSRHDAHEGLADHFAVERIAHMLIESMIDVGNLMIDGFIMRDPGSYEDIIDILVDEKVLPKEQSENYKDFISLRNMLIRDYLHIDHDRLYGCLQNHINILRKFGTHIRTYLDNESGVANAFAK